MGCQEKAETVTASIVLLIVAGLLAIFDWMLGAAILMIALFVAGTLMFCSWCSNFLYHNPTFRKWICRM